MREWQLNAEMPTVAALRAMLASQRLSLRSLQLHLVLKRNFNPAQPRVPRGIREGGQWTDDGGGSGPSGQRPSGTAARRTRDRAGKPIPFEDSEFLRVARRLQGPRPHDQVGGRPVRVAQSGRGPRGRGPRRPGGGNRIVEPTPAQEAHLVATRLMLDAALQRVRAADPRWRPAPSLTETVRGEIISNVAQTREADFRFFELQRTGI